MSKFKAGDRVELMDDNLEGRVEKITSDFITVRTTEGFLMDFPEADLVRIDDEIDEFDLADFDSEQVKQEKKIPKKPSSQRVKPKERNAPPMEVDLHIHQLKVSSKNMSNHEMLNLQLDTARHKLEFAMRKRIQKVVFIHGVGEGVLKMELDYLFSRYSNLKYYDADYKKYGLGATEVYIFQNA
ncbi:MAG: Smr/MutS family protein [Christiangramia sp.]|uniref:Smr/MutS family protein n=1 Tax=Christiangramia sp. TaxID=1931228 RepID=UPI0032424F62